MDQLTFWPGEALVRIYPWLDAVKDWEESGADCSGTNAASLMRQLPVGFYGRTSLALCPPTTDMTSPPCCGDLPESARRCPRTGGDPQACVEALAVPPSGGCLTLNTSESPSDVVACSLSQVILPTVPSKYFLSPQACAGMLKRAARRNITLPKPLLEALADVGGRWTPNG